MKRKAGLFGMEGVRDISEKYSEAEISMILDTFMYMDYREAGEGTSLRQIVNNLSGHPDYGGGGIHSGEYAVLKEAVENEEVGSLKIYCQSANMGYDTGTAACAFQSKEGGNVYVVYRGTGDGEWMDNGLGMTSKATIQQTRALSYFEEVVETMGLSEKNRVIITGHSKGGNKAQFVTMETKYDKILDACYSVDGQGFSEQAVYEWKHRYGEKGYKKRTQKLYGIHGENDYVSVLGNSIIPKENIRYVKTPVEKSNFAGYHDIKYMFASLTCDERTGSYRTVFHGRKNNDVAGRGELAEYAAALSMGIMELRPGKRDGCAAVIMQIMEAGEGQKSGMNGEKLHLLDVMDFTLLGIPMIAKSFFQWEEGKNLLSSMFKREAFDLRPDGRIMLRSDGQELLRQTLQLSEALDGISGITGKLEEIADKLPFYMKGYLTLHSSIRQCLDEIERLEKKMRKLCSFQRKAAVCYNNWNEKELPV